MKKGNFLYHTVPYHTIPYHTIPYHTIPAIISVILYYCFICEPTKPLLLNHVGDLRNGTIPGTPLLQQTIRTLAHGVYNVTGGAVHIGFLGNGHVTKVIGVTANDTDPGPVYTSGAQPFNSNFASILFELRQAKKKLLTNLQDSRRYGYSRIRKDNYLRQTN